MRAAKVQASLRIRAVSPEPPLLAHTSSESRGSFRPKARSLAPLNGWACAVKTCHDGMLEDTNSLDGAQLLSLKPSLVFISRVISVLTNEPRHPRSLISAFIVRSLDSIIPLVSISDISSLYLAFGAAQAG